MPQEHRSIKEDQGGRETAITSVLSMRRGVTYLSPANDQDGMWAEPGTLPMGGAGEHGVCGRRKLTTGRAAVRPLTRVPDSVLYQLPLHVERLPALIAGEDFVSRVRLFVLLQITEVTEP